VSKAGYLAHVRKLHLDFEKTSIEHTLVLEDLARFFYFCPKLTDLTIQMKRFMLNQGKIVDDLSKNEANWQTRADLQIIIASELRQGFSRLERVKLHNCLRCLFQKSWTIYQNILT
jgi:hypothetical protein